MKFITEKDIESLNDEYYKNRYIYFKHVIDLVKLIDNVDSVLELGPYKSPLIEGEDVIDITDSNVKDYPIKIGEFYKHNCAVVPYPFKDKQYDLVIGCQVLEHFGKNQKEVFKELSRISKTAIITLPYKWFAPCDKHHMIDERAIDYWAQGFKPSYEKIIAGRLLRVYNFDDDPQAQDSLQISKKLKKVESELDPQEQDSVQISKKLKKVETELNDKNRILDEVLNSKKEVEKELNEKNRLLALVLSSNSWKLTKPFRELRLKLK